LPTDTRLLRAEGEHEEVGADDAVVSVPPKDRLASTHIHRQKRNMGVLHTERDWLHVGAPDIYAAEMSLKHALYSEHADKVYVTAPESVAAEQEVLELVLEWLAGRYPERFRMASADGREQTAGTSGGGVAEVQTLTPGYEHTFEVAAWAARPLVLVGMLVQEDFYLLDERPADAPSPRADAGLAGQGDGFAQNLAKGSSYDAGDHTEDHPSGVQHVMFAACSCFSFDAVPRHNKPMSAIHHPNVPGWKFHLQRHMNRLFATISPELSWFRHTQDLGFSIKPVIPPEFQPRPIEAFTGPFAELIFGEGGSAKALHGLSGGAAAAKADMWEQMAAGGDGFMRDNVLFSIEFQTLRRMPASNCVLFTVRRYIDPLSAIEGYPAAAAAVAATLRRKYKGTLAKSGLGQKLGSSAVLHYLDGVAERAGLAPGLRGVVPEPWERAAIVDGTTSAELDKDSIQQTQERLAAHRSPMRG
jgi:hypothetical protein